MKIMRYGLTIVLAVLLSALPVRSVFATGCAVGKSVNVVAHEDDDLLFMNPGILHDIQSGRCVQTMYLTAGDGGAGSSYWASREAGVRAAYAQMAGVANTWDNTTTSVLGRIVHLSTLTANPAISLSFLRLPDGGEHDGIEGFDSTNHETLRRLWQGTITTIHTVDSTAVYTRQELIDTIAAQLSTFGPDTVRSLDYTGTYSDLSGGDNDHWDHHSSAYFTQAAQQAHTLTSHQLTGYKGYTVEGSPANVSGTDLTNKQDAFYIYNAYDGSDCTTTATCTPLLANYLQRQYTNDIQSGTSSWQYETMEGDAGSLSQRNADVGSQPATVTFNNDLYAFYFDNTSGYLRYAQITSSPGAQWSFSTLDGSGGANGRISARVGATPTAVIYNNQLHVFYYDQTNGNLRHAWSSDGVSWTVNNHDGDPGSIGGLNANVGKTPLAIVYGTSLQLFYYDSTNGNLRHSWMNGGVWSFETLDGDAGSISGYSANVGTDVSASVYDGSLQLFYYDATLGDLRHTWADSTGWHFENLDGSGGSNGRISSNVGETSSTVVQGDVLHTFYYDQTNGNLRHIWTSPGVSWQAENLTGDENAIIGSTGDIGAMPSAIINGTSLDVFAYDATQGDMVRLSRTDTSWREEHVDGFGVTLAGAQNTNLGFDPSVIAYNGKLHAFYYDPTNGNLRHAEL